MLCPVKSHKENTCKSPPWQRALWVGLAGLTALRLVVAATLPLVPDEAYYALWATLPLQGGYYDHPFMVALWMKGGMTLLGPQPLGVRLAGPLGAWLASWALARAVGLSLPSCAPGQRAKAAFWVVMSLNATPGFSLAMLVMTPDVPLMVMTCLGLWALMGAWADPGRLWRWGLAGFMGGLAFDSKYTAALPWGGALANLLWQAWRHLTKRPPNSLQDVKVRPAPKGHVAAPQSALPALASAGVMAAAALLAAEPVLLWNARHGGVGLVKQFGRLGTAGWGWHYEVEFMAGQLALATPLLVLCWWRGFSVAQRHAQGKAGFQAMMWLVLPGLALFTFQALHSRVQPNWPLLLYPMLAWGAGWLALWGSAFWQRLMGWGVGLGLLGTVGIMALAWWPLPASWHVSAHWNVVARQSAGWDGLLLNVRPVQRCDLVVADYALAARLAWSARSLGVGGPFYSTDQRWKWLAGAKAVINAPSMVQSLHEWRPGKEPAPGQPNWPQGAVLVPRPYKEGFGQGEGSTEPKPAVRFYVLSPCQPFAQAFGAGQRLWRLPD
ncbi:glycosyltransferase family 39 protein [Formicincola oecophyllae]|nr:glycosyltransferase family 39 protein [Formicincola oecophyllae]